MLRAICNVRSFEKSMKFYIHLLNFDLWGRDNNKIEFEAEWVDAEWRATWKPHVERLINNNNMHGEKVYLEFSFKKNGRTYAFYDGHFEIINGQLIEYDKIRRDVNIAGEIKRESVFTPVAESLLK